MTTTTVLLLVVLWGVVLVPGAWRDRRSSPATTVDGFSHSMARLASCDSRSVLVPAQGGGWLIHPRPDARQLMLARRRAVAVRLVGLVVATFWTAVAGGGAWWALFVLAAGALAGYLAALRAVVAREAQVARVVLPLHPAARRHDPEVAPAPAFEDEADLWREGAVSASVGR